jgi:hypothetical protein
MLRDGRPKSDVVRQEELNLSIYNFSMMMKICRFFGVAFLLVAPVYLYSTGRVPGSVTIVGLSIFLLWISQKLLNRLREDQNELAALLPKFGLWD